LAKELGISQGQFSRYEQDRAEIGAEILLRMAARFSESIEFYARGISEAKKN
jgi:transcriptional regulator with XRE-family HTH domain